LDFRSKASESVQSDSRARRRARGSASILDIQEEHFTSDAADQIARDELGAVTAAIPALSLRQAEVSDARSEVGWTWRRPRFSRAPRRPMSKSCRVKRTVERPRKQR
jgi:hypothetical protein